MFKKNIVATLTILAIIIIPIIIKLCYHTHEDSLPVSIESNFNINNFKHQPQEALGQKILHKEKVLYESITKHPNKLNPIHGSSCARVVLNEQDNNIHSVHELNQLQSFGYAVQLASLPTKINATKQLKNLIIKYPTIRFNCAIKKVDFGRQRGIRFQIICALDSHQEAVNFCAKMHKLHEKCLIAKVK